MYAGFEFLVRTEDEDRWVRIVGPSKGHLEQANKFGKYSKVVVPVLKRLREKAAWELEACGCLRELHEDGRITKLEAQSVLKSRAVKEV